MHDHHKLGRELQLFHSEPLVGAGLPIWLPAGAAARHAVEAYLRELERRNGYQHVYSPPLAKREMYERSGHLPHFADDMFPPMPVSANDEFVMRPSLCPHHAMVFAARGRSYRELPVRIGEIGGQYRAERSGVLGGLSRVRAISLNDGHVFCAPEQVVDEVAEALRLMRVAQAAIGFAPSSYRLSLRGAGGKYVDDPEMWAVASDQLREALKMADVSYVEAPGEAAFYGPKIDVQVMIGGRELTLATVQVDYHQPRRFDLSYVDANGARRRPVMVHRSAVGSLERLFAHLIEVAGGAFPAWYAPVQVAVLPVGEAQDGAARAFRDRLVRAGLRAELWPEGSVGLRVREAAQRKVPLVTVIGAREAAASAVSVRDVGVLPVDEALADLVKRCQWPEIPA
jgi:threonyl-tRNA synthetase